MPTLLTGVNDPPSLGQQYPADHPYAKGKTHNAVTIAAGATNAADLVTAGYSRLILLARMTGSASADLQLMVHPYEDDGSTDFSSPSGFGNLVPTVSSASTYDTVSTVRTIQMIDLAGVDKVKVILKNANAGQQTASCIYYLQK